MRHRPAMDVGLALIAFAAAAAAGRWSGAH